MTPGEVISSFREMNPCQFGNDTLMSWLSELEATVVTEIVLTHEGAPEGASSFEKLSVAGDMDRTLTAPHPYSKIYFDYLKMKADMAYSDSARYAESSAVFGASYADFADYYNRAHMPRGAVSELTARHSNGRCF